MRSSTDFLLGTFIILCGFVLSLINLRRIVKNKTGAQAIMLSENLILTCIGVAFIIRSIYDFHPMNINMENMEDKSKNFIHLNIFEESNCDFKTVLITYGPLVLSFVNSFVSLVIDNYMHYRMIENSNRKDDENMVQEIGQRSNEVTTQGSNLLSFIKTYFPIIASIIQWIVPIVLAISMYPIGMKEEVISGANLRSLEDSCLTMLDMSNETHCSYNHTQELRNYIPAEDYLTTTDRKNMSVEETSQIKTIIDRINSIVTNYDHDIGRYDGPNVTLRRTKSSNDNCYKMCLLETKPMILYMFALLVVSYFVPITISTIILTKIHVMDIKKPHVSMHVTRELLYNVLFWSPVMVDTFLSMILCSYVMNGTRTSMFNVVANVYQIVKNIMNTKHFKWNSVVPA